MNNITKHTIPCDSLIFDMDGTLWDAVDSYVTIWNDTLAQCNIEAPSVTRQQLLSLMGKHLDQILATLVPSHAGDSALLNCINDNERTMMPVLGGKLYPLVEETLRQLHGKYRLFMVSNCGSHGLENFLDITGLRPLFTDALSAGQTMRPKHVNICTLIQRYNLKAPCYVGDTETDAQAAKLAGIPMIWCSYGFGTVGEANATIDTFPQLCNVTTPL